MSINILALEFERQGDALVAPLPMSDGVMVEVVRTNQGWGAFVNDYPWFTDGPTEELAMYRAAMLAMWEVIKVAVAPKGDEALSCPMACFEVTRWNTLLAAREAAQRGGAQ